MIRKKVIRKRVKNQANQVANLLAKALERAPVKVQVNLIQMTLEPRKKIAKNVLARGNVLANLRVQQNQIHSLRKNN